MLVRKKISAKKLAIYLAIIFFMIGGGGFMILQNKKLTSDRPVNVSLPPAAGNAALAVPGAPLSNAAEIAGANSQLAAIPGQTAGNNLQNVGSFNLSIFSSDKFKNLLASVFIAKEPPETGKRDPFKPN